MKNLKKFFGVLAVSLILGLQFLNGQGFGFANGALPYVERSEELLSRLRLNRNINAREELTYEKIDGDPFLFRNFILGAMVLKNGEAYSLNLRYDIFKEEMQFRLNENDNIYAITNAEEISALILDSIKFQNLRYGNSPEGNKSSDKAWFILKTDGRCKLLIKKTMRLQEAQPAKAYQDPKPPIFIQTSDLYFLKLGDKNAVRVKSKNDILSILADKKNAMQKFIKSGNLGANDMIDLEKIVTFYNNLQ